jgi:Icc-related predicted phosphoesterase
MIIDCISDLHGFLPELEGGDLLIVAGDLTARDTHGEYLRFLSWLHKQKYRHYIFIAGNHDNLIQKEEVLTGSLSNTTYLCDSGTEFEGLKIWGTPWTAQFPGINPHCCAFTIDFGPNTEKWLAEKWALIPSDTDILISHSPPYGILDSITTGERVGSKSLQMELFTRLRPKLFVCGHIHEAYGVEPKGGIVENAVNASHVNERYKPVNKPVRIVL